MATEKTNYKGREVPPAGQQCVRPTVNGGSNQVDACNVRIPGQVNMDQGRQGRKLFRVANDQRTECGKILSGNR